MACQRPKKDVECYHDFWAYGKFFSGYFNDKSPQNYGFVGARFTAP
jgi:hypothetical protein